MEKSLRIADITEEQKHDTVNGKSQSKQSLVAAIPKNSPQMVFKRIIYVDQHVFGMGPAAEVGYFILKLAVLEAVRRISMTHCPILWRSLQALQFVCLPPLKWLNKWGIFRGLIKFMQALSKPILLLSISTSLCDQSTDEAENSSSSDTSQSSTDLVPDSPATRTAEGVSQRRAPEKWILQLLSELEKEGMTLPESITDDELRRFYKAAKGEFPHFLVSVKKTILWRQSFRFLSAQELDGWSELVFWHGHDVKGHPCLNVRLAPACFNIAHEETSRLPEVIASQIEHGILHLVHPEDPLITVLMDCEGLTPFRFPLQMMRSCAILLQDHYPNRLATLFVVRLPPVARVIAQTLFQVLRPGTRRKLQVLGYDYKRVLSEQLDSLSSALGGDCSSAKCTKLNGEDSDLHAKLNDADNNVPGPSSQDKTDVLPPLLSDFSANEFECVKWNRVWKTVIVGLLILLICILVTVEVLGLEGLRFCARGGW